MAVLLMHIGLRNCLAASGALGVMRSEPEPVRRSLLEADRRGQLADDTIEQRVRAVTVLDRGHVALSALRLETIIGRLREHLRASEETSAQ